MYERFSLLIHRNTMFKMLQVYVHMFRLYIAVNGIIVLSSAHFTTNSNDLQDLFEYIKNTDVFYTLDNYIGTEEINLDLLKHFMDVQIKDDSLEEHEALRFIHPAMVLKVARRRTTELPDLVKVIQEQLSDNDFVEDAWTAFMARLPNPDDLRFIVKGLVRLMDVHKLTPTVVARGQILRHKSRGLDLDEITDIGFISLPLVLADAIDGDMINVIMSWLYLGSVQAGAIKDLELRYKFEVALIEITRFLYRRDDCQCSIEMIMAHNRWKENNPGHSLPPFNWTCDSNKKPEKCMKALSRNTKEHENFSSLCRYKQPIYFTERHVRMSVRDQYCKLEHYNHPLLILQPIKLEIRSPEYPYRMLEFHDLLSESEIDYFMKNAGDNMTRGLVNLDKKANLVSDRRIGENSHLPREKHHSKVMRRVWARLSAISNLTMSINTTEQLRLANYATTGYFSSHMDFLQNRTLDKNNRFVTFLLYLNDVDGGETVFPFINIRVEAKRGKGFMFNNLYRNTTGIMDSRHGSCPIITGDKWIVTHWTYRFGHEFSHPCSLSQLE